MTRSSSDAMPRGTAFTTPVAPRHDALPPGTRLDEYEIGPLLGESPIGLVYLATDTALDRQVAIREYLPLALSGRGEGAVVALRSAAAAEAYRRGLRAFVEEGRLLARFDHPSLLRVLRFWEAHFTAYLVMPFCDAPTLVESRQRLAAPPAEDWVRGVIDALAGALELLHEQSCLHRRVSPMRVRMMRDGHPVLLGPSAVRQVLGESAQAALAQPGYSAIEEYAESAELPQGPWTDVYSLGALARYCILGTTPPPATVRSVRDTMVPMAEAMAPLRAQWPELQYSTSLMGAIDRALAVDPRHRPQSIAHFRMLLASGAPMAPPQPQPQPTAARPAEPAAPLPEFDPETTQLQASLSAMVDAAIADAPPMRTVPPRSTPEPVMADPRPASDDDEPLFQRAAARRAQTEAFDRVLGAVPGRQDTPAPEPEFQFEAPMPQDELSTVAERVAAPSPPPRPWWMRKTVGGAVAALALVAVGSFGWRSYQQYQTDKLLAAQTMPMTSSPSPMAEPRPTAPRPAPPASSPLAVAPPAARPAASEAAFAALPVAPTSAGAASAASSERRVTPVSTPTTTEPGPSPAAVAAARAPFAALDPMKPPAEPVKPKAAETREARREARVEQEPPAPRAACGGRTAFSLYYCMKQQCDKPQNFQHVQCKQLRLHDTVD
jgi:serine/threonine protein kinase